MPREPSKSGAPGRPAPPLPRWLLLAGSLVIVYHLAAVILPILDTPSGPWPVPYGRDMAVPPPFAHATSGLAGVHGKYLRLAHSYQFVTDRPADLPTAEFDVLLRNDKDEVTQTLHFPDPHANPWVRHRQEMLASSLALDFPTDPQGGEVIAAPGQKVVKATVWMGPHEKPGQVGMPLPPADLKDLRLQTLPQHLVPRLPPGQRMRPSEWSLILAQSYARYLCRTHGAATAEIVRHKRDPAWLDILFGARPPPDAFDDYAASFGKMSPAEEKDQ